MAWRVRIGRLVLSVVLLAYLGALVLWNLPSSALRERFGLALAFVFFPTGLWQQWGMFAPDPMADTVALEGDARDARGMRHSYRFPAMAGVPVMQALLGYRHSKFAHNMAPAEGVAYREFAARHVVRALALPPEAFPVDVDLSYRVWRGGMPGLEPTDEMTPPEHVLLQSYRFPNWQEARP